MSTPPLDNTDENDPILVPVLLDGPDSPVQAGDSVDFTLTVGTASASAQSVIISASDASVFTDLPMSVTVPANSTTAAFTLATSATAPSGTVTVTAGTVDCDVTIA